MDNWDGKDRRSREPIDDKLHEITQCIIAIKQAFPDGDIVGHRQYHEAKIKAAIAEEAFWTDLKLDVAKKGVWGVIVILVGLVMLGLSVKIGHVFK